LGDSQIERLAAIGVEFVLFYGHDWLRVLKWLILSH